MSHVHMCTSHVTLHLPPPPTNRQPSAEPPCLPSNRLHLENGAVATLGGVNVGLFDNLRLTSAPRAWCLRMWEWRVPWTSPHLHTYVTFSPSPSRDQTLAACQARRKLNWTAAVVGTRARAWVGGRSTSEHSCSHCDPSAPVTTIMISAKATQIIKSDVVRTFTQ